MPRTTPNQGTPPTQPPDRDSDDLPYTDIELNDNDLSSRFGLTNSFNKETILSYNANVLSHHNGFLKLPKEPETPLHFGVELEICVLGTPDHDQHGIVNKVYETLEGRAIVCHDGSVSSGFEIVTVPATIGYHKELMWNDFFNSDLTQRLVGMPYCGNHIHVSKAAWTPLTVGKLLSFVHNPDNPNLLDYISKRGQGSYCTRHSDYRNITSIVKGSHNRSAAVNVTPSETIEFRMFRSSINPSNMFKNLEFIDAIRMFTFHHKISDMQADKFLGFMFDNKHLWPYLNSFCQTAYSPVSVQENLERSAA